MSGPSREVPRREVIERAIRDARQHTAKQLWLGIIVGVGLPALFGFTKFMIVATCLNAVTVLFMGRRFYRLRPASPAVTALLDHPERIVDIRGMPAKAPPGKLPILIFVRAEGAAECTLIRDAKRPDETLELAHALRARSPQATFSLANVALDTTAS